MRLCNICNEQKIITIEHPTGRICCDCFFTKQDADKRPDYAQANPMNVALYTATDPFKKDEPPQWPDDLGDITL